MNQSVKTKWVAALRSGEYKQGSRVLRSARNTFCCLGVLCDLYHKEHPDAPPPVLLDAGRYAYDPGGEPVATGYPPTHISDWAELVTNSPRVEVEGSSDSLVALNDNGSSFEEIADLIERCL